MLSIKGNLRKPTEDFLKSFSGIAGVPIKVTASFTVFTTPDCPTIFVSSAILKCQFIAAWPPIITRFPILAEPATATSAANAEFFPISTL